MNHQRIVFIGLGGIAHSLFRPVMSLLAAHVGPCQVTLVDHDVFEKKNRSRQPMCKVGDPKAEVVESKLADRYPQHDFQAVPKRLTTERAEAIFSEKAVVFGCVDNHHARRDIAQAARQFDNLVSIVGANGNDQAAAFIFVRRDGKNYNPPYDHPLLHPDIADPKSQQPDEHQPQITAENDLAASFMQLLFFHWLLTRDVHYDEILCRPSDGCVVQKQWSHILPENTYQRILHGRHDP